MADVEKRTPMSAEHARLEDSSPDTPGSWKAIGPYLSERAWGTVREDYGADGQVWQYFPYEQAPSWRLSVERGWSCRALRSSATPVFCSRLLEWA
jgi:hypothetical protein